MNARRAAVSALLALSVLAPGCGGGGGGDTESTTTSASTAAQVPPAASHREAAPKAAPKQHPSPSGSSAQVSHDSATGTAAFETKGGDNSIQEFGSETGTSERDEAAAALHGYLDARSAGEWAAACSYLASGVTDQISQLTTVGSGGKKAPRCAKLIAALSAGVPAAALHEAAQTDVGALRVNGDSAFLFFHGAHGADYFMPMSQEGGAWKVAAIASSPLP